MQLGWLLCALGIVISAEACNRHPAGNGNAKAIAPRAATANQKSAPPPQAVANEAADAGESSTQLPAPDGFVRMTVGGIAPTAKGNAVLLVDGPKKLGIPIFIGEAEALAIQLRLEKRRYDRPLTHDLLDSMMLKLGGRVESVRVDKVQNEVYFGTVIVTTGLRRIELDSRSSDAVALAVGNDAPIFVAQKVVDHSAIALEALESHENSRDAPEVPAEPTERPAFTL